jgi:hypothetical protein
VHLFSTLLDAITRAITAARSPPALAKLAALRYSTDARGEHTLNAEFHACGFTRLVAQADDGTFSVLRVVREVNPEVCGVLPAPVWVVSVLGPVGVGLGDAGEEVQVQMQVQSGDGELSVVGSFVEWGAARARAREYGEGLAGACAGAWMKEVWDEGGLSGERAGEGGNGTGNGNGVLVVVTGSERWEVRVRLQMWMGK